MMFPLAVVLAATTPGAPNAPSAGQLAAAIGAAPEVAGPVRFRTDTIRSIRCRAFEEEPTEFRCRFKAWANEGRWERRSVIVAIDKQGWLLLSLD
jgi:hypothetical protein